MSVCAKPGVFGRQDLTLALLTCDGATYSLCFTDEEIESHRLRSLGWKVGLRFRVRSALMLACLCQHSLPPFLGESLSPASPIP